jgi:hypothetical protein
MCEEQSFKIPNFYISWDFHSLQFQKCMIHCCQGINTFYLSDMWQVCCQSLQTNVTCLALGYTKYVYHNKQAYLQRYATRKTFPTTKRSKRAVTEASFLTLQSIICLRNLQSSYKSGRGSNWSPTASHRLILTTKVGRTPLLAIKNLSTLLKIKRNIQNAYNCNNKTEICCKRKR